MFDAAGPGRGKRRLQKGELLSIDLCGDVGSDGIAGEAPQVGDGDAAVVFRFKPIQWIDHG